MSDEQYYEWDRTPEPPSARVAIAAEPRIEVAGNEVRIWGLTQREYVLAAIEALDQAGVTAQQLADAVKHARGTNPDRLLAELCDE